MPRQVNASHILLKDEQEANAVMFDVTHGKDFEDTAKQKSLCPSKKNGGKLGWFGRNQMVKEFETACFNANKGNIIGPVKTQFGYHIIKINDQK